MSRAAQISYSKLCDTDLETAADGVKMHLTFDLMIIIKIVFVQTDKKQTSSIISYVFRAKHLFVGRRQPIRVLMETM